MSNAIAFRMPLGIAGVLSRAASHSIVEPKAFNSSLPFPAFGVPGKIASAKLVPIAAVDDVVAGFLVRPYPSQGANASDALGTSVPRTTGQCGMMSWGFMTVKNNAGTPADGGQVYVRYAATSGAQLKGGIEAANDAGNNFPIPGCFFTGAADADGNCEIKFGV